MKRQRIADAEEREIKFFDTPFGSVTIPVAGTAIQSPNLVPQGTQETSHVGRAYRIIYLGLKYLLAIPSQPFTSQSGDAVRLIVYLDKQANGALAAVTDVLTSAGMFSFYNPHNADRFEILDDAVFSLSTGAFDNTTGAFESAPVYKHVIRNYDIVVDIETTGTTGAVTGIKSNNIGIFWLSFNGFATVVGSTEVQFMDS